MSNNYSTPAYKRLKTKLRGFGPRANYTDRKDNKNTALHEGSHASWFMANPMEETSTETDIHSGCHPHILVSQDLFQYYPPPHAWVSQVPTRLPTKCLYHFLIPFTVRGWYYKLTQPQDGGPPLSTIHVL
jgi:hypothetical protein